MTTTKLAARIGMALIVAHVGVVMLLCYVFLMGNMLSSEFKISLAIVVPTLAAYGTAALAYFIRHQTAVSDSGKPVTGAFVFVSWFLSASLVAALVIAILVQNRLRYPPEDYALVVGAIEAGFGAYVSQIVKSLFGGSDVAVQAGGTTA